jgi:hypothetical protein
MPARTSSTSSTAHAYRQAGIEPPLAEMLADPIVRTLMKHDSISDETIIRVIADARAKRVKKLTRCTERAECCFA